MRLSLRFLIPLALAIFLVAYAITPVVDTLLLRWHVRDLDIRAALIASSLQEAMYESTISTGYGTRTSQLLSRVTQAERVYGMALCDQAGTRTLRVHALSASPVWVIVTWPSAG